MSKRMFEERLKQGLQVEERFINILAKPHSIVCRNNREGKASGYDFIIDGVIYESKMDTLCSQTGNVPIEYMSGGKPSGISLTNAHYYLFRIISGDIIYYLKTDVKVILKYINKHKPQPVQGGNRRLSSMYLIPFNDYLDISEVLLTEGYEKDDFTGWKHDFEKEELWKRKTL